MTRAPIAPPEADEYAPFYAGYVAIARTYHPVTLLEGQMTVLRAAVGTMTDSAALHRYAPDKWSIKQVVGHLSDAERVMSYRLFRISRGDETPLSAFDENAYVAQANSDQRPLPALLDELESARVATLRMVEGIPPEAWTRRGTASSKPVSARALLYIIGGHLEHHLNILRERYGVEIPRVEAPTG
jgi:hypothetical protein